MSESALPLHLAPTDVAAGPVPQVRGEIPGLDGLRGIAILLVLAHHLYAGPASHGIEYIIRHVLYSGWIGVDLFFVLSGFLITGILYDTKGSEHYYRNFYARRFLRIFPLYYGFLLLWLLVAPHIPTFSPAEIQDLYRSQGWYWSYLANVHIALHRGPFPAQPTIFWSLAIEEQFYLFWPLLVASSDRRRLIGVCLGVIILAPLLRTGVILWGSGMLTADALYALTPFRLDALAVGGLAAVVARSPDGFAWLSRIARPVTAALTAVLAVIFVWRHGFDLDEVLFQTVGYTLLALAAAAWLVRTVTSSAEARTRIFLESSVLRFFGRYSYGLYVWHAALYYIFYREPWIVHPPLVFGSAVPMALAWFVLFSAASTVLAVFSWRLYEKHFLALKRYFPYRRVHAEA